MDRVEIYRKLVSIAAARVAAPPKKVIETDRETELIVHGGVWFEIGAKNITGGAAARPIFFVYH
jgi:hypothetical protein